MEGVREYNEELPVELWRVNGRLVVRALNEGGNNGTEVDLLDLVEWLRTELTGYEGLLIEAAEEIEILEAENARLRELHRVSFIQMLAILRQNGDRLEIYNSSFTDVDPLSDTIIHTGSDVNDSTVLERRAALEHDKGEPKP